MITKQTIREEFDKLLPCIQLGCDNNGSIAEKVGEDEWEQNQCQYCFERRFPIIDLYDSQIQSLLEQIIPEKANERNTGKISQTEILSYEQSSGWNLCLEELKSRIINAGFEVK